ncbi:unnamed protein product [Linum trigynum]|uniref:Uncharacterized protein n=1 Tax=Linum trigynum TaxID=586398 RepID=A0AAV2F7L2_9ROSI
MILTTHRRASLVGRYPSKLCLILTRRVGSRRDLFQIVIVGASLIDNMPGPPNFFLTFPSPPLFIFFTFTKIPRNEGNKNEHQSEHHPTAAPLSFLLLFLNLNYCFLERPHEMRGRLDEASQNLHCMYLDVMPLDQSKHEIGEQGWELRVQNLGFQFRISSSLFTKGDLKINYLSRSYRRSISPARFELCKKRKL